MTSERCLVTGGAGFIGSNLVASLAAEGHEVVVCDRLRSQGKWRNLRAHRIAALVAPEELPAWLERRPPLEAVVHHAFGTLDLSRIEAACLPENTPSRALLERTGFKYEGVAQSYLQISGRWRNHVLYANLRSDRRGRVPEA